MQSWPSLCRAMTDTLGKSARSELMSRVRQKDTSPELAVRRLLHSMGYRFRLHVAELPGKPDIVLPRYRAVVQVHGCFWHGHEGCPRGKRPSSNVEFWSEKIAQNKARDERDQARLQSMGWQVVVVWECELKDTDALSTRLKDALCCAQRSSK